MDVTIPYTVPVPRTRVVPRLAVLCQNLLLPVLLVVTAVTHAYHMFLYPNYTGDEGIYMEQAWAVLQGKGLAPYTYYYDHAPAGWIFIAAWLRLLPGGVHQWGMAINSGRMLMLLVAVGSTALLFRLTYRLTVSAPAAALAGAIFALSPLSLYYGRMVLLDNIMILWLLVSLDLITEARTLFTVLGSGLAFGIAVLTKENAIYFAPVLAFTVYLTCRGRNFYAFGVLGWMYTCLSVISLYPLFALLKGELLGTEAFLVNPKGGHVNLLGAVQWQLTRTQAHGTILDYPNGTFWNLYFTTWASKDTLILVLGTISIAINCVLGLSVASLRRYYLLPVALALAFALYLVRGAVLLEFYILPLLPFLALNIALAAHVLLRPLPHLLSVLALLVATGGVSLYFVRGESSGQQLFTQTQTKLEADQLAYIRTHLSTDATIMISDDLWVDLHDGQNGTYPSFPFADSHFKISSDPAIRDAQYGIDRNWRNIDYVVEPYDLAADLAQDTDPYKVAITAFQQSVPIWTERDGVVTVAVRKVVSAPASRTSYFAGVVSSGSEQAELDLLNTGPAGTARITAYAEDGRVVRRSVSFTADAEQLVPLGGLFSSAAAFGVEIAATHPLVATIVEQRAGRSASTLQGTISPARRWYLADGYTGNTFQEHIAILNPDQRAARVSLDLVPQAGQPARLVQVTVPAHTLYRTNISTLVNRRSIGAIVTADSPVVLERTLDFGVDYSGSTTAAGIATPVTSWTFASQTYDAEHQAFFAILNPAKAAAQVTITFYDRQGDLQGVRSALVPAHARGNIQITGMQQAGSVTAVATSTVPVVIEEPVYGGQPNGPAVTATYNGQKSSVPVR
jgi:4-amino-4-deoxy-L-arabinose transferase-like glycosyltransferase